MQYDDNIAFHPARGETSDIFFVRGENTCSISMGDSASPTLLFDCPITVGVAAPIDCGADQSDRKACLKLTSDSHTCTIAMGSTSEELITDCIFGSGATVEAISSVDPTEAIFTTPEGATSSDIAPATPCPACCSGFEASWATTQISSFETVTAADSAVLMSFADDQVCGGEATTHQHMTATATITLENDSQFDLLWSGVGEAQYETLTITVNGVVKETFQALADGSCQMGSCTMCNTLEQTTSLNMLAGTNTIEVVADSIDGQYHQGAYFAVRFRKAACTEDCSVCGSR